MTIRRGEAWGVSGPLAPGAPVVADDRSAAAVIAAGVRETTGTRGTAPPEVGLTGGDLHRTLGRPLHTADQLRSGEGMRHPVDLGHVALWSGAERVGTAWFLAHLVAGGARYPFWRHTVVVMNADHLGSWVLGPRAHANDGRLDATSGRLGPWDALRARQRFRTGTHLPHPGLTTRRSAAFELDLPRVVAVRADGREVGRADRLVVTCHPDAGVVVV